MKKNNRFLLYGEGSFLNKGCEAIVNTTVKKVRRITDGDIILATNDIDFDSKYYNDIIDKYVKGYYRDHELTEEEKAKMEYYNTIEFDYNNFEKIRVKDTIKEIDNCDICMSIGGDNYAYGASEWLYTINKETKARNKKTIFWGTSIYEKIDEEEMIRDLKTFDLIIPRETLTYNALAKFIDKDRLLLGPDTAFSLERKEVELPKVFKNNKKVVGINISPLVIKLEKQENNLLKSVQALIDKILKDTDYNVILIPHVYMKGNSDLEALKVVKDLYKEEERVELLGDRVYDCEELKYVISKCNYLIAARTHASIAGYSTVVPTLVIGYSVKSKGIALDLFGDYKNYVVPINEITPNNLIEKFEFIRQNEEQIIKTLKDKMDVYKKEADELLEKAMERLEYLEEKEITHKNRCTGCMACLNACPKDAIKIVQDKEGFLHPEIDKEKCTKCGLCKKICPMNQDYKCNIEDPKAYAVINKNEEERINSSSGGFISVIAQEVLNDNGVIYGVALEENEAKHIRIDNKNDLYKIMGSKYLQSKIDLILREVKEDLENGKKVLFTGTPCQIEGLNSYLNKEYNNLICLAVICHGVPSPEVFKRYLEEKGNIDSVNFRNKNSGWHKFSMKYLYEDGTEEVKKYSEDTYMKGFLKNYFLRESCYNCQARFDNKNRADIIIGDYWGIENVFPDMDDDKGVSALILNSEKAINIFEKLKDKLIYRETNIDDISKANPVLTKSVKYTKNRDLFFELIKNNQIEVVIDALKGNEDTEKFHKMRDEVNLLNKNLKDLLEAKQYFLGQIEAKENLIQEKDRIYRRKK